MDLSSQCGIYASIVPQNIKTQAVTGDWVSTVRLLRLSLHLVARGRFGDGLGRGIHRRARSRDRTVRRDRGLYRQGHEQQGRTGRGPRSPGVSKRQRRPSGCHRERRGRRLRSALRTRRRPRLWRLGCGDVGVQRLDMAALGMAQPRGHRGGRPPVSCSGLFETAKRPPHFVLLEPQHRRQRRTSRLPSPNPPVGDAKGPGTYSDVRARSTRAAGRAPRPRHGRPSGPQRNFSEANMTTFYAYLAAGALALVLLFTVVYCLRLIAGAFPPGKR